MITFEFERSISKLIYTNKIIRTIVYARYIDNVLLAILLVRKLQNLNESRISYL